MVAKRYPRAQEGVVGGGRSQEEKEEGIIRTAVAKPMTNQSRRAAGSRVLFFLTLSLVITILTLLEPSIWVELVGIGEPGAILLMYQKETEQPSRYHLRLVQVGANDGSTKGNDQRFRSILAHTDTTAILVEGNPQIYQRLLQTVATVYGNSSRIIPMNALACPEGADLTFHVVNDKLKKDFPGAPHWVLNQLSSLEINSTITGLEFFFSQRRQTKRNALDYIDAVKIPCTSFSNILERGGFDPKDVDVLAVDVEGHDAKVVTEALQVPGFSPGMIIFEFGGAEKLFPDELSALFALLEQRGYTTDCLMKNGKRKCPGDVVATKHGESWTKIRQYSS